MNLLDMDMGSTPAIMPAPDSTAPQTGGNLLDDMFNDNSGASNTVPVAQQSVSELLGSSAPSNPSSGGGGFDLMGMGQPVAAPPAPVPQFKGIDNFNTQAFGGAWMQMTVEQKVNIKTPLAISTAIG